MVNWCVNVIVEENSRGYSYRNKLRCNILLVLLQIYTRIYIYIYIYISHI